MKEIIIANIVIKWYIWLDFSGNVMVLLNNVDILIILVDSIGLVESIHVAIWFC